MSNNKQIIFSTMSGHSKKIAYAISKELNIPCNNIKDNPTVKCDTLFIVSGIYSGQSNPQLLEFIKGISSDQVKQVVLVTSSATLTKAKQLRDTLEETGIPVCDDEYICQGGFLIIKMFHPNKKEIADAVAFCKKH